MKNRFSIILVIIFFLGVVFIFSQQTEKQAKKTSSSKTLSPANSITHGHGIAVDVSDPTKLYIATHHGLLVLKNDKDLYHVGESKDDYMGFSPHPANANVIFSSGHPKTGGNIGFQRSDDGGFNWTKIADGVEGPVDFHAMAVSHVNPNRIFGWFQGTLQTSEDSGRNWSVAGPTKFVVVTLAADTKDENILYAASPQGVFGSRDKGRSWNLLSQELDTFVSAIAVNPQDSKSLLSYSEKLGIARSNNSGKTWERINQTFEGETPLYITFNKQDPKIVYLLTEKNSIYKSIDGANSWDKIR